MTQTPSGPAAPAPRSGKDPVQLLIDAVGTLPQADRDLVYAWLLRRLPDPVADELTELGRPGGPGNVRMAAALLQPGMTMTVSGSAQQFPQSSGQQMVPVRFSSEQHARLREWCAEHGFSMATVVRGLVARFLEGQLPEAGQQV
jgi:ParG